MHVISNELHALSGEALPGEILTEITSERDVLKARQIGRFKAISLGFRKPDVSLLAAAISEVARNIIEHAHAGHVVVRDVRDGPRKGLRVIARDRGPGIRNVEEVTQYGSRGFEGQGVGLPGTKLLMDDFEIISSAGRGTTITMTKWISG
jgi:serine/threonine-protein kinase RsbT